LLAALGLVFSDQGSAVGDVFWLRGAVAKIVNGLATCPGGLKILCEAAEKAEDESLPWPVHYDPDGEAVLGEDGKPERLHPDQGANAKVRALANRGQKPDDDEEGDNDNQDLSPLDRYLCAQRRIAKLGVELHATIVEELPKIVDYDGMSKMTSMKLDREILGALPEHLAAVRDLVLLNLEPEIAEPEDESEDGELTGLSVIDGGDASEEDDDDNLAAA
jgi:hypothetical protein